MLSRFLKERIYLIVVGEEGEERETATDRDGMVSRVVAQRLAFRRRGAESQLAKLALARWVKLSGEPHRDSTLARAQIRRRGPTSFAVRGGAGSRLSPGRRPSEAGVHEARHPDRPSRLLLLPTPTPGWTS